MKNFYTQLFTLLILLLCNFVVGLLPLIVLRVIRRWINPLTTQRNRVLSFFLHMGGGVFMSVCLLILLPESRQQFEEYERSHQMEHAEIAADVSSREHHHEEEFPIPEFVILCGFFATFAVEEALHYILYHCRRKQPEGSADRKVGFCSCAKRHTECSKTFKAENPEQTMFGREKNMQSEHELDLSRIPEQNASTVNLLQSSILAQPVPNYGSVTNLADPNPNETVPVLTAPVVIANNGKVTFVRRLHDLSSPVTTSTSNVLFVIALSLYALIQGATIGLETQSSPWTTLLVTCFQQSILVFIIGWVGVAQKEHHMPVMLYVAVLSLMSPFGISLSMFFEQKINDIPSIVSGVSKAVVCGSLLYLTFCDLLRRRSLKESPHIERFAGFTLGAAIMAALESISIIL